MWKQAYFSTDLSFTQVKLAESLSEAKLEQFSFDLVSKNRHNSFEVIRCSEQLAWVITSPLPKDAISIKNDLMEVFPSEIGNYCRGFSLDFAGKLTSKTLQIFKAALTDSMLKPISVKLGQLAEGFVSLTCLPHQESLGPILWALIPTREPNQSDYIPDMQVSERVIFDWINEKRSQVGLQGLTLASGPLLEASRQLAIDNSTVYHDRNLLKQLKNKLLESHSVQIVGENRVRSHDLLKMKWLLWYSPRHRQLLLNRGASEVALFSQKQSDGSSLLVLLFARKVERSK